MQSVTKISKLESDLFRESRAIIESIDKTIISLPVERRFRRYSDDADRAMPDNPSIIVAGATSIKLISTEAMVRDASTIKTPALNSVGLKPFSARDMRKR
jgi:hypothetical protein